MTPTYEQFKIFISILQKNLNQSSGLRCFALEQTLSNEISLCDLMLYLAHELISVHLFWNVNSVKNTLEASNPIRYCWSI